MSHTTPGRMPAIFCGHGSPMNALHDNRYTETWKRLAASLPRPRAILAISAHWDTHGTAVTAMAAKVRDLLAPVAEHFLPLLYVLGSRIGDEPISVAADGIERGSSSMLTAVIGDASGIHIAPGRSSR
jgi:aromatic ring-opening dioxygenase catalytic subunit (LigB family)